jgi:phosphatidylserine/phosphatidylglycerophosphate/cardiolipin synthase-like enzyme
MESTIEKNSLIIGANYAKEVCALLDTAKTTIEILMYDWVWYKADFSCDMSLVNSALVRAVRRGVKIRAITNKSDITEQLNLLGIEARPWGKSKAMHAKVLIVDSLFCVIGSHNLTQNAMGLNIEISVRVLDENIGNSLTNYFNSLWSL